MSFESVSVEALLNRGDLLLVQDGNHGGNYPKVDEFRDFGVPLITGACLDAGRVSFESAGYISEERATQLRVGFAMVGDVLLTHKGTMGKTALVQKSAFPFLILNPQITLYRVSPSGFLRARYLKYFFDSSSFQEHLSRISSTSTISTLPIKEQKKLEIPVPPVSVQDAICGVLGTLDDRIALLRETNATLEAIAQALFKSWFVDFDPVRAKMEGRVPEGMVEATAALFPDALVESELGLVPDGWHNVSLKEAVSIHDSKRIPLSGQEREKRKGAYPYYGAAALMDTVDDYLFDGVYLLTGEDGSVADANGYPITQYVWGKFWVNNHAHILQGKDGVSTEHVMLALRQTNITPYITGAVQAKLSQANMWRINFLKPTREVSEHFGALLEPLFVRFRHNAEQAQTLATLRDTLLPRLISGQLRLPETQAAAEGALA